MIRAFLVHLGRFFRMLLLSAFVCVLLIPLAFNILEIIFGRFAKQDNVYLICALISLFVSALYTFWQKDRVNSDEVIFFMRNRMIKQGRRFNHFIALNAILVAKVGNYDLNLHIKKYKEQLQKEAQQQEAQQNQSHDGSSTTNSNDSLALMDLYQARESTKQYDAILSSIMAHKRFQGQDDLDNKARALAYGEALAFIESLMSSVSATDKQHSAIAKVYIATLLDNPQLAYELNYVKKISKKCGPYLCELLFVLMLRTLMNVNPFKIGYIDYRVLLEHPTVKQVGAMLLEIDEDLINSSYYNRFFFLLNQEQVRIRQKWINSHYQEAAAAAAASASASAAGAGADAGSSHGHGSSQDASAGDGFERQYSYSYSYKDGFREGAGASEGAGAGAGAGAQFNQDNRANNNQRYLSKKEKAYITLGLDSSSTIEQVKKQYRKLAFKYHPDHIADYESFSPSQKQELNAQFLAIVQAYEIILKDQA